MSGFGVLACVSCTISPIPPSKPIPVPEASQVPAINVDNEIQPVLTLPLPSPTPVKPVTKPTIIDRPASVKPAPSLVKPVMEPTIIDRPVLVKPTTEPTPVAVPAKPAKQKKQPTVVAKPPPVYSTPVAQLPPSLLSLNKTHAVHGGIAWIPLHSQSNTPPKILYKKNRVVVLRQKKQWVALVGIPLDAKQGRHTVIDQQTRKRYSFIVKGKSYGTPRHLKVKKRQVDLKRIARERKKIQTAKASPWQATSTSPLPFVQPVRGRFSNKFGLRRYFNNRKRSNRHTGLDIAAPIGRSVVAAAAGKIVNIGHYFYTGKTVLIDHGQSVVTMYAHLNTITVSSGQKVKSGQKIGTVGKTGRVTGPHLHWSVSLNKTWIDPMLVKR
ncbi:peptidoglycan DD-metalloendopeptidase family protein [Candidatus Parabeggiatoa sp. HSG14]|uniref:peptidoglycan DD-metalloendopeptidase family protein n=1 Tax=Candidatus Parabeggiatoa sp. HSG14 TaxID=3055593 RepID=UPI0032E38FE1